EVLGWIGGAAAAGHVPGHDRELVGQYLELLTPLTAVARSTMKQDQRGPFTRPAVGDSDSTDFDLVQLHQSGQLRDLTSCKPTTSPLAGLGRLAWPPSG